MNSGGGTGLWKVCVVAWHSIYKEDMLCVFCHLWFCWTIFLLSVLCIIICSSHPCGKYLALFLSKCHWRLTLSSWCWAFTRPLGCFCAVFILTRLSLEEMPQHKLYSAGLMGGCTLLFSLQLVGGRQLMLMSVFHNVIIFAKRLLFSAAFCASCWDKSFFAGCSPQVYSVRGTPLGFIAL